MRPAPIPVTLAAAVIAAATALAGCSSATADGKSAAANSARPTSSAEHADAGSIGPPARAFFDPCTDEMLAWFGDQRMKESKYIASEKSVNYSSCGIGNRDFGAIIGAQVSTPDDPYDRALQYALDISGVVVPIRVNEHAAQMSIADHDGARQDCYVAVTVEFGYIDVVGAPHGQPPTPPARDCDRSRTLAAAILAKMTKDGWH